jgi:sterol desaturase/sphingolipid hydroxylase (fatty acid hydroxylase superfamily)
MSAPPPPFELPDLVLWATPVFVALVVLERVIERRRGARVYHFGTAVADIACGLLYQMVDVGLKVLSLALVGWVYAHGRLVEWDPSSPWLWLLAIVGLDLAYYAWHRASHEINALWAIHAVHHQSEDYNLAVALRQPALQGPTFFAFTIPLALLGVPPELIAFSYALNLLYQFWIHTELVGRLGWFERWFNTPSAHRVHHGVNPRYLDKNYAGIWIVWDRLFGTYEPEDEPVVFGVTTPLRSHDPLWANVEHWLHIAALMRAATSWRERLWAPWAHPAWRPRGMAAWEPRTVTRTTATKWAPELPPRLLAYVGLHAVLLVIGQALWLALASGAPLSARLGTGLAVVLTMVALAAYTSGKGYAPLVDVVRIVLAVLAVAQATAGALGIAGALAVSCALAAVLWLAWRTLEPWRVIDRVRGLDEPAVPPPA